MSKITTPQSVLVEKTALELAACFYEVGRSQGLHSKYKTARHYAAANIQKFIPHAVDALMKMLIDNNTPESQRAIIHAAIMERINDPVAMSLADASKNHVLPNIDIAKLIPVNELPSVIVDQRAIRDYIK